MNDHFRRNAESRDVTEDLSGDPAGSVTTGTITVRVNPRIGDIVDRYLKNRDEDVSLLLTALDRGEFHQIKDVAHDLVGTGGSFGFDGMSLIGRSLNIAAEKQQTEEIKTLIEGLAEYISRVEGVYE